MNDQAPINIPGSYTGKLIDWAVTQTKAGMPQIVCMFEYLQDGKPLRLSWFGSFQDKAVQRTFDTLRFLGLKGNDLSVLADGVQGKGLEVGKVANIVVEIRTDLNGKPRAGISWVNDPSRAQLTKKLDKDTARGLLEVYSLRLSGTQGLEVSPTSVDMAQAEEQDLGF